MRYTFIILCLMSASYIMAQEQIPEPDVALQDTVKLQEVVVTVSRPISKIEGDGLITRVQGSILQNLGTAKDVLGFIPGIQNNNGAISVIGKGSPTIYLNGRIVRTSQELDQLRSEKIKDIKLITNPGARYDGEANSIIKITTVKNIGDGFALDTRSSLKYRDYLGTKEDVSVNYRHNKLDIFGTFEYDYQRDKGQAINIQDSWLQTYNRTQMDMLSFNKMQVYDGKLGFNYSPSDNHNFGIYYQVSHQPSNKHSEYSSAFYQNNNIVDNSELSNREHLISNEHLIDAYYNGSWGNWNADFSFDALWKHNDETQSIYEQTASSSRDIRLKDKNSGRLLAGELNLSHKIWSGSIALGGQYSNSDRKDSFLGDEELINNSENRINEGNIGIYVELSQNFKWIMAQIGLRYEHIYSNYFENGIKIPNQCRKYNELLPSVNFVFPIKKTTLQIGYSRKYTRPLYSQLSNTVTYVNQYLYESGNPFLKSSFSDNVSLNFRWNWLMIMCSYKHVDDQIITAASAYNDSETITLFKKENSPYDLHSIQAMVSFVPGMINGFYYPTLTAGMLSQFYNIDYKDGIKKMNRPMPIIQFNNMFRLPNGYILSANVKWRGKGDSENVTMGQSWQLDLSAQKSFGKHWSIKLSANDIFNTAHKTSFTIYSNSRRIEMYRLNTSRSFELTVSYKFNTTKSKYKGKGTAQEERERL